MIQRFYFVKLLDSEVAGRAELAGLLRAQLLEAGADAVVGLPADASAARWDLSIVLTTASFSAWSSLSVRPDLVALLASLALRAAVVKSWTFDALPPAD